MPAWKDPDGAQSLVSFPSALQIKDLKDWMIFTVRMNRKHCENHGNRILQRDWNWVNRVSNMWYNPRAEAKKRITDVSNASCTVRAGGLRFRCGYVETGIVSGRMPQLRVAGSQASFP